MSHLDARSMRHKAALAGLLGVMLALSSCVAETQLVGEGPPPGYISGDIPAEYRGKRDPFTLQDQRALQAGSTVYQAYCAVCHGDSGMGDGPRAYYLEPKPANYAAPPMLTAFRTHQDYVFWWVSDGVPKTVMPAFKDLLSETERWQVITHEWSLGEKASR